MTHSQIILSITAIIYWLFIFNNLSCIVFLLNICIGYLIAFGIMYYGNENIFMKLAQIIYSLTFMYFTYFPFDVSFYNICIFFLNNYLYYKLVDLTLIYLNCFFKIMVEIAYKQKNQL